MSIGGVLAWIDGWLGWSQAKIRRGARASGPNPATSSERHTDLRCLDHPFSSWRWPRRVMAGVGSPRSPMLATAPFAAVSGGCPAASRLDHRGHSVGLGRQPVPIPQLRAAASLPIASSAMRLPNACCEMGWSLREWGWRGEASCASWLACLTRMSGTVQSAPPSSGVLCSPWSRIEQSLSSRGSETEGAVSRLSGARPGRMRVTMDGVGRALDKGVICQGVPVCPFEPGRLCVRCRHCTDRQTGSMPGRQGGSKAMALLSRIQIRGSSSRTDDDPLAPSPLTPAHQAPRHLRPPRRLPVSCQLPQAYRGDGSIPCCAWACDSCCGVRPALVFPAPEPHARQSARLFSAHP